MAGLTSTHLSSQSIFLNLDESAQILSRIWQTLLKHDRAYKPPFSQRETLKILAEDTANGWYNPALVEQFFRFQVQGLV